jgi:hypothetical protein
MNNATGTSGCRFLPRPSGASPLSISTMSTTFNAILHHILIYYEQMHLELLWSTRPSHGEGSWAEFAHFTAMLETPNLHAQTHQKVLPQTTDMTRAVQNHPIDYTSFKISSLCQI